MRRRVYFGAVLWLAGTFASLFPADDKINPTDVLKALDTAQYTLSGAGAKEFSCTLVFNTDLEDRQDFLVAEAKWAPKDGFFTTVKDNKRPKKYKNENITADLNAYFDDFLIGPNFTGMVREYELSTAKNGKCIEIVAKNDKQTIQSMVFTITPDQRVSKITFSGSFARAVTAELSHKQFGEKWYLTGVKLLEVSKDAKEELLRTLKTATIEYKEQGKFLVPSVLRVDGMSGDKKMGEEEIKFWYRCDVRDTVVK